MALPVFTPLDLRRGLTSNSGTFKWGILGAGRVCHDFVQALKGVSGATVVGVSARTLESAQAFATKHHIPKAFSSYEEMCKDTEIDIVYVGTVQHLHTQHALLAIHNNKHVVVEKPLACAVADVELLLNEAQSRGLFLHEGMWTRFFPVYEYTRELIEQGSIGDISLVLSDFGINAVDHEEYPSSPFYQHGLGGGSMMFVGVYPIAVASFAFGHEEPTRIAAAGVMDEATGVDLTGGATLQYGTRGCVSLSWSISSETAEETILVGPRGRIKIHSPAHCPTKMTVVHKQHGRGNVLEVDYEFPLPDDSEQVVSTGGWNYPNSVGFAYEAEAVQRCIQAGLRECPQYTHREMLVVARIMDSIRQQIGVAPFPSSTA